MTPQEWNLIFDGFTAVGTVGAVVFSLWAMLHRNQKFKIKGFSINKFEHVHALKKSCLCIEFENLIEAQMEIKKVEIDFLKKKEKSNSGKVWGFQDEIVAPLSHYELLIPLEREWVPNSLRSADETLITIKTSFGNRSMPFPTNLKKRLCDLMELSPKTEVEKAA